MAPAPGPHDLYCRRTKTGPVESFDDYSFKVRLPAAPHEPAAQSDIVLHRESSAEGFCWGRPNGCTRDLALNVLDAFLPVDPGADTFVTKDGRPVSVDAHRLHLDFSDEFLVPMPSAGGIVEGREVRAWIQLQEAMVGVESLLVGFEGTGNDALPIVVGGAALGADLGAGAGPMAAQASPIVGSSELAQSAPQASGQAPGSA